MFSLELPHRGDSNEHTQYTIFKIKKKISLDYSKSAAMGFCSWELKNEFETTVVNKPSVFEPLKFYCVLNLRDNTSLTVLTSDYETFSSNQKQKHSFKVH